MWFVRCFDDLIALTIAWTIAWKRQIKAILCTAIISCQSPFISVLSFDELLLCIPTLFETIMQIHLKANNADC